MDKETQKGMLNLDRTAKVADEIKAASTKNDTEFADEQQQNKVTDRRRR
jgi:hypothetical protein